MPGLVQCAAPASHLRLVKFIRMFLSVTLISLYIYFIHRYFRIVSYRSKKVSKYRTEHLVQSSGRISWMYDVHSTDFFSRGKFWDFDMKGNTFHLMCVCFVCGCSHSRSIWYHSILFITEFYVLASNSASNWRLPCNAFVCASGNIVRTFTFLCSFCKTKYQLFSTPETYVYHTVRMVSVQKVDQNRYGWEWAARPEKRFHNCICLYIHYTICILGQLRREEFGFFYPESIEHIFKGFLVYFFLCFLHLPLAVLTKSYQIPETHSD